MPMFWLTFSDLNRPAGQQVISVITDAEDLDAAVAIAHTMGCDPGGECSIVDFDDHDQPPPSGYINRLLDESDIAALEEIWTADQGCVVASGPTAGAPSGT
jgi:hypothetical protein